MGGLYSYTRKISRECSSGEVPTVLFVKYITMENELRVPLQVMREISCNQDIIMR